MVERRTRSGVRRLRYIAIAGLTFLGSAVAASPAAASGGPLLAVGDGFEVPFPVVVLGGITGMTYGILAVGLVLVYRSNRIINFAHGEIGAFAAAVLGLMVTRWGVPYWPAFVFTLAFAGGVGSLSEILVVRRLRNAPLIMSVVATLGLAQFLLIFSLVVNAQASAGRLFPEPPGLPEFDVGALRVTRAYSGMLILTPLLVIALVWFLRRTRVGLAIRAAAANRDAARVAGVFAGRMSTLTWAMAGAVAAFTAVLVLPTRGFANAQFLGPGLLLRALTAAVIARMESLPVAVGAGLAVGIGEQVLLWNSPRGGQVEALLFGAILITLLLQPHRGTSREDDRGSWVAVQAWPPVADHLRRLWIVRRAGWIAAASAGGAALIAGLLVTNATAVTLVTVMAFGLVGLSVGIVTGLGGQLSLGQFALAGVGATASYVIMHQTGNWVLAFIMAGLAAAAASLIIGLPSLRIRGLMLAVTTLGFALAAQNWLFQQSWMLGEGVDPGRPIINDFAIDTGKRYYFFSLVPLAVGIWLARNAWTSGVGRRLRAIRENEDGARAFTVSATAVKLQGFVLAGFLAGLGGAMYGHVLSRISATTFPIGASIDAAAMAVLGGLGILAGPLLGAFYIIGIPQFLPLDNAGLAATELGWLLLVLYLPGGLGQALRPLRDRLFAALARRAGIEPEPEHDTDGTPASGTGPDDATAALSAVATVRLTERRNPPAPVVDAPPLLAVSGLSRRYGGINAVDEVSFAVATGETVGLIGPNGAGKTTLFDLVSGFTRPDGGTVTLAGTDIGRLSPEQRGRQGLIRSFQEAALFPTLTVTETVMLALERVDPTRACPSLLGLRKAERRKEDRARELVDLMGLHRWRHTQTGELSTGTRRVTELACLMALEPLLLLLDEPTAGIAQRETEALGQLLVRLKESLGLTLLVIEHDIPLIMGISDRVLAMESGRLIADGPPDAIRNDPAVIASYLGTDTRAIERSGTSGSALLGGGGR
jgi:ABC-type branched-subunit amino acid transport system ATPase component/ABC-type branched-subunit amino acid transport system permease subunit